MVPAMVLLFGGGIGVWYAFTDPPGGIVGAARNLIAGKPITEQTTAERTAARQAATIQAVYAAGSTGAGGGTARSSAPVAGGSANEIVAYARTFLGIPYRWGGTSRSGLDCSGLTTLVAQHFGVKIPRTAALQAVSSAFVSVPSSDAQPGDFVYFSHGPAATSYHCGIYEGGGKMTHAPKPGAVVRVEAVKNLSGNAYFRRLRQGSVTA